MNADAVSTSALRTLADYTNSLSPSSGRGSSELDMDDFLELFIAQLSCQDPLSSSSSGSGSGTDYISQLAQLTMLKQISALNDAFSTSQAFSMIGRYVYIGDGLNSDLIFGKVDGVIHKDGANNLMVGGETYDISEVYAVIDEDSASAATDDEVLKSADLIGKTVTASVTVTADDGTETTSAVTGRVEKILVQHGAVYLAVGDQNIALRDITEIAEATTETTIA